MTLRFIFLADPMCSWCWGFAPTVSRIRETFPEIPVRLVMGGLYPGVTKPMKPHAKEEVRKHWEHVNEASGQPFDYGFFDRETFVYDTEPASRALITAKKLGTDRPLEFLETLQGAFYRDNRDVTDTTVLADIAAEFGLDRERFLETFASENAREMTERDFAFSRQLGIHGFPSLLGYDEERYRLLAMGYQEWDWLENVIRRWIGKAAGTAETVH